MSVLSTFFKAIGLVILFGVAVFATAAGSRLAVEMFSTGTLTLENVPADAQVYIDGGLQSVGSSQTQRVYTLERGEHLLEICTPGYEQYHNVVKLQAQNTLKVELQKMRLMNFNISTTPQGAYVLIDGVSRGRTPLKTTLPRQNGYTLELTLANYFPVKKIVSPDESDTLTLDFKLENRQETAYRKRLKQNPNDIEAYNDLGELLFVLGRFDEAADIFIHGISRIDNIKDPSQNERHNMGKLSNEARNKHHDPKGIFRKAFDSKLINQIKAGTRNKSMLKQLQRMGREHKDEYLKLLPELCQDDNPAPTLLYDLLRNASTEEAAKYLGKGLRANYDRIDQYRTVATRLSQCWKVADEQVKKENAANLKRFSKNINKSIKTNTVRVQTMQSLIRSYKIFFANDYYDIACKSIEELNNPRQSRVQSWLYLSQLMKKDDQLQKAIDSAQKAIADCKDDKNLHNVKETAEDYLQTYQKALQKQKAQKKKAAGAQEQKPAEKPEKTEKKEQEK